MTLRRDAASLINSTKANASAVGIANNATNLGTFTGSTIPDNRTAKQAIQALETAVEGVSTTAATKANATAVGVAEDADNLGTFTSALIDDDATVKAALASIATNLAAAGGSENVGFLQTGTGAVARTGQSKLRDMVSALDFADAALIAKIVGNTATSADTAATTAAIQAAINRRGSTLTPGTAVPVFLPDGTYYVDYLGLQGTALIGQSRLGTIIKCNSGGVAAVLDARYNRDGTTANTNGNCIIENLSVDVDGKARTGVALYGGSCVLRNVEIYGSAGVGLLVQYVLKTTVINVTCRDNAGNGINIDVDEPLHTSDVNTSLKFINVWSLSNGGVGISGKNMNYCSFDNVTTQANAGDGWNLDGGAGGVNSMNSIVFNVCASEQDGGRAFTFKKLRNFVMLSPFVLAEPSEHTIYLDDCLGAIVGFTDTAVHTGGTVSLKIVNAAVLGGVTVDSGNIVMDGVDLKFCSFRGSIVNGALRDSLSQLWMNDSNEAQSFYLKTTALGGDYSGLGVYDAAGLRVAAFRRFSGGMIISSGGATDPAALNNGDFIAYVGTTTLTFQAKGTDGTVRTGTVTLS